ncbi:hypothetical protein MLD38_035212 [Melastoma candidum]|uniref:Uncharacterized protein n=1 Tax=Melastoma candidum TaxID=119954 RepID=A0ACB9MC30_9MYRT|nr:hypothetical protein MLD38_035212 [Melastoma candidum]
MRETDGFGGGGTVGVVLKADDHEVCGRSGGDPGERGIPGSSRESLPRLVHSAVFPSQFFVTDRVGAGASRAGE